MQVVNDFGPLSNGELLRRYGFVECSDNPHDCVELSVEDVMQVSTPQLHRNCPFYVLVLPNSCTQKRTAHCVHMPGCPNKIDKLAHAEMRLDNPYHAVVAQKKGGPRASCMCRTASSGGQCTPSSLCLC